MILRAATGGGTKVVMGIFFGALEHTTRVNCRLDCALALNVGIASMKKTTTLSNKRTEHVLESTFSGRCADSLCSEAESNASAQDLVYRAIRGRSVPTATSGHKAIERHMRQRQGLHMRKPGIVREADDVCIPQTVFERWAVLLRSVGPLEHGDADTCDTTRL